MHDTHFLRKIYQILIKILGLSFHSIFLGLISVNQLKFVFLHGFTQKNYGFTMLALVIGGKRFQIFS